MIETVKPTKKQFGQYFTPKTVADFMVSLADIEENTKMLEPACGEGIFLEVLKEKGCKNCVAYEIDKNLAKKYDFVRYESFISANIEDKFDLIIGNPPYIRWKNLESELKNELLTHPLWNKYCNSLCDYLYIFILKSIELLAENGQLIFICPEYWLNTTHSLSLRNYMVEHGYFEEIYHFNETPIFEKATVSVIIFKYIKSHNKKNTIKIVKYQTNKSLTTEILTQLTIRNALTNAAYLTIPQFQHNERWVLQTDEVQQALKNVAKNCRKKHTNLTIEDKDEYHKIGDFCEIGNGLVSGLDKAFQIESNNLNKAEQNASIKVVKAKDIQLYVITHQTNYIFVKEGLNEDEFKNFYPHFYAHLQPYKIALENRYQYNKEIKYWEWVFLRNLKLFQKNEKRIFVPSKERISHKNYFRFALVDENNYPTQDVTAIFKKQTTRESIEYILAYLNQPFIFNWVVNYGIMKGNIVEFSEKPLANIPFRAIDWQNEQEIALHDAISSLTKQYITSQNKTLLTQITECFHQLFERN